MRDYQRSNDRLGGEYGSPQPNLDLNWQGRDKVANTTIDYGTWDHAAGAPSWIKQSYDMGQSAGQNRAFGSSLMQRVPGAWAEQNAYNQSAQRAGDQWGGAYERNVANYDAMGRQLQDLRAAAAGQVPSAAEVQQRQGLEQALRAQMAAANSGPGGFNPAAQANAARAGADMMAQGAGNAAALRAQEQAQARAAYTSALGQQANAGNALMSQAGAQQAALYGQGNATANLGLQQGQLGLAAQGTGLNYDQARAAMWAQQAAASQGASDQRFKQWFLPYQQQGDWTFQNQQAARMREQQLQQNGLAATGMALETVGDVVSAFGMGG